MKMEVMTSSYCSCSDKIQDYDYLSSLEIVICDQLDVMLMQNWEHIQVMISYTGL